jgi:CBS domain-containing protein
MEKSLKVGELMTRKFIYLGSKASVLECAKTMTKKRVGSLIIKDGDKLKGIVTEKDIIWALVKTKGENLSRITAGDIATKKIISIRPDASINEALEKMSRRKVRKLPVMAKGKVIGYLTLKDILKFNPKLFDSINEINKIKEESSKIKRKERVSTGKFIKGICENCGEFDILSKVDGVLICDKCRDSM